MSTHNIGFYEDLTKIIFLSSANTHLISSGNFLQVTLHGIVTNNTVALSENLSSGFPTS